MISGTVTDFTKGGEMADMLTAKEMQALLQVDRSTIYRMAEAGQLPAMKIGKQWRFPGDLVQSWFKTQGLASPSSGQLAPGPAASGHLASLLPLDCVQLIQDAFAEALSITLVVTDLAGQSVTQVSQPGPLYSLLIESETGGVLCQEQWQALGRLPALEPRFVPGFAGLLSARALVRFGHELKGMVVVFGLAPADWPPAPAIAAQLARSLNVAPDRLQRAFEAAACFSLAEQKRILVTLQRMADILAHVGSERVSLLSRLDSIARLSVV